MKITVGLIGSGGFIGSALRKHLEGTCTVKPVRSADLYSGPEQLSVLLEESDVIINLAGYPVAGRWNKSVKSLIYNSRVKTTSNLVSAIGLMAKKPALLINASAVGIYADGDVCDESNYRYSENFLAKVVKDWESEAGNVINHGVNLSILRLGVVLSRKGGAYPKIRTIFRLGAGGIIGTGNQGFSYLLLEDLLNIFDFVINNKVYGVINAVSPDPVSNKILTRELAKSLKRFAIVPLPSFLLKLVYGEGSIILLEGQRVKPSVLLNRGFSFVGNNLPACLENLEK